jgi:hypothetical protein
MSKFPSREHRQDARGRAAGRLPAVRERAPLRRAGTPHRRPLPVACQPERRTLTTPGGRPTAQNTTQVGSCSYTWTRPAGRSWLRRRWSSPAVAGSDRPSTSHWWRISPMPWAQRSGPHARRWTPATTHPSSRSGRPVRRWHPSCTSRWGSRAPSSTRPHADLEDHRRGQQGPSGPDLRDSRLWRGGGSVHRRTATKGRDHQTQGLNRGPASVTSLEVGAQLQSGPSSSRGQLQSGPAPVGPSLHRSGFSHQRVRSPPSQVHRTTI